MFPILNFLLYIFLKKYIKGNTVILLIYLIAVSIFFSLVKLNLYEDDFFGYNEHYQNYLKNKEIPYYSEGREFILTALIMLVSIFEIDNIEFFSFSMKIILYSLASLFFLRYKSQKNEKNYFVIILALTSPNFIIYTDSFIRQSLSLIFLLLSLTFNFQKKIIYFLLSIFTHLTNLIYLPMILIEVRFIYMVFVLVVSYLITGIDYGVFSAIASALGMSDKLYFIDQMYQQGMVDTRPSVTTFLPAILIIIAAKVTNKNLDAIDNRLINLFLYSIIIGNLVSGIPYASSRISMLVIAFTPVLFVLLKGRVQILLSAIIYFFLWSRFIYRDNPTLELNYQYLVWPFGINI
jgi:hypothetical protein